MRHLSMFGKGAVKTALGSYYWVWECCRIRRIQPGCRWHREKMVAPSPM